MNTILSPDGKKVQPMVKPLSIPMNFSMNAFMFQNICEGYLPASMDEKWYFYFEKDWLHVCRSWTGIEMYKTQIYRESDNVYSIKELWVETEYFKSNEFDVKSFIDLVEFHFTEKLNPYDYVCLPFVVKKVFEVLAEGGGIRIEKHSNSKKTYFYYKHNEFDPTDEGLDVDEQFEFKTFEEPFQMIHKKYQWFNLYVSIIHPDYREYVIKKLRSKLKTLKYSEDEILGIIKKIHSR